MKLPTLMIVNAFIAGVFGVGLILAPAQVTSLYGPDVTPQLEYVARLFGAALVSFAVLTWTARNAPDSQTRRAMLLALFMGDGIGFVVALIGQLGGVMNALGWSTVGIYLLLTLAFGYFCFARPKTTGQAGQVM